MFTYGKPAYLQTHFTLNSSSSAILLNTSGLSAQFQPANKLRLLVFWPTLCLRLKYESAWKLEALLSVLKTRRACCANAIFTKSLSHQVYCNIPLAACTPCFIKIVLSLDQYHGFSENKCQLFEFGHQQRLRLSLSLQNTQFSPSAPESPPSRSGFSPHHLSALQHIQPTWMR